MQLSPHAFPVVQTLQQVVPELDESPQAAVSGGPLATRSVSARAAINRIAFQARPTWPPWVNDMMARRRASKLRRQRGSPLCSGGRRGPPGLPVLMVPTGLNLATLGRLTFQCSVKPVVSRGPSPLSEAWRERPPQRLELPVLDAELLARSAKSSKYRRCVRRSASSVAASSNTTSC
jgi:hypothetical protein